MLNNFDVWVGSKEYVYVNENLVIFDAYNILCTKQILRSIQEVEYEEVWLCSTATFMFVSNCEINSDDVILSELKDKGYRVKILRIEEK